MFMHTVHMFLALLKIWYARLLGYSTVSYDVLKIVVTSHDAADYFLGGKADWRNMRVVFIRGDLRKVNVPMSWFPMTPLYGKKPDFDKPSIIDWGQTVRLGTYEVLASVILCEIDPVFRRRVEANNKPQYPEVNHPPTDPPTST